MSLFDYQASKQIVQLDPPFAALIMAAYRRADTGNACALEQGFPDICRELRLRYNAPGGLLDGERMPPSAPPASDEYECCASGSCEVCRR